MVLGSDYTKKHGLTYFLKGSVAGNVATPLGAQESYKMDSFAKADCLIILDEIRTEYRQGESVEVCLL
jgi:molybdopterin molybdotransferase